MNIAFLLAAVWLLTAGNILAGSLASDNRDGGRIAYSIPFLSDSNTIELVVIATDIITSQVSISVHNAPEWLRISPPSTVVELTDDEREPVTRWHLVVDRTVPCDVDHVIEFEIATSAGDRFTKEIVITIEPPTRFELFQNYPNPFNPSTSIDYHLPTKSDVVIRISNMLGQLVDRIVEDGKMPGYHRHVWNGSGLPSGIYVYELSATDERPRTMRAAKRLILLK